jgi:predicted nucleotidyltransferase
VSFALKSRDFDKSQIKDIILFGSVSRGDFSEKSDIDLFINTKNERMESALNKLLEKFYKSEIGRGYSLRGVNNRIKLSVGNLDSWKLKRSIISDGILLYGSYREAPGSLEHYFLFLFEPIKDITKRNRLIRKLFGRKETGSPGLSEKLGIKQISERSFVVPSRSSDSIIAMLEKEKVVYKLFEIWSDSF